MLALALAAQLFGGLPELPALPEIKRAPSITYLDRTGAVIAVRDGHTPPPVNLAALPDYVPAAFVAIEDRRFYEHAGFDPVGIARAVMTDVTRGRSAQGASTITQQLARNLFLTQDQTMERKATELVYAVQLEQKFSKRQILSLYLSRVYFGSGAWGIEAASRRFFDHPASKLTLREAAALASVLKSPSGYSPVDNPERNDQRTALVLDAMVDTGAITPGARAKALARPLKVRTTDPALPAQYFLDWVDQQTRAMVGKNARDLVIETTLDLHMEESADAAARAGLGKDPAEQTALVALDGQGRVRAMVGGVSYGQSAYNRALLARRQAGSSWKPFVYLTAMEAGMTPDTVAVDEPITINGWSPRNHTNDFLGPITLEKALAESVNTVAARTADAVGRDRVAATARRLGIASPINLDPAMALGTSGVTPYEMATAYTAFANGGQRVTPYAIERIRFGQQVVFQHRSAPQPQVIANPPLGEMDRMMRGVITSGTGRRAALRGYDLAGKTGTTSDSKDAWFCGFTGGLTAVVWVGRDDAKAVPGLAGAGPPVTIWRSFMAQALPRAGATGIPLGPPPPPSAILATTPITPEPVPAPTTGVVDPVGDLLNAPPAPVPTPPQPEPEPR